MIEDEPLWYQPARGSRITWRLSYRHRGAIVEDPVIFGVGTNWSCSFRAFLVDLDGTTLRLHRGGAGVITYTNGVPHYRDGSICSAVTGGYQIEYRDGATDLFTHTFFKGYNFYFLTSHADPAGNAMAFNYAPGSGFVRLSSVQDPDGKVTQLYYENATFTNLVTKVVDPFSRTNLLKYDSQGYLTNITDVAQLSSSFGYDAANPGWITNMTTPYGTTTFVHGGVDAGNNTFHQGNNQVNRFLQVFPPIGAYHLYLYRQDCSAISSVQYSPVPSTSPLANTLDNVDQQNRNSFRWSPLQSQFLSTSNPLLMTSNDYVRGHLSHWLIDPASADPSWTLSLERPPSQDGTNAAREIWYDYDGKTFGNNYIGTNALLLLTALVLTDGSTRYVQSARGGHSQVTRTIDTYSKTDGTVGRRTNWFYYAANNIDLLQQVGPNGEQVVSNYFAPGNVFHQPNASYDALNQETLFSYNANRQLTGNQRPSGLMTTNLYYSSGNDASRLLTSYDFSGSEVYRSNAFTYVNGLASTVRDERGVATTRFWDNLQRLTGVSYPDGSATSNRYTLLDLTASKDRLDHWSYAGFNQLRQKVAETNANATVTRYGYCECGALTSVTNAFGSPVQSVTTFAYDYQGNRTYVYLPDAVQMYWFDPFHQLTNSFDGVAMRRHDYNNQGLLTNLSNAYGTEQAVVYDIEDRPIYVADANGVMVTNTYDLLGRVCTRGYPDGGVESFGYSARGLIAYTNQIGRTNYFAYDPAGRKTFETNANAELIQYRYDASGNLTNLIDGKNQGTGWAYDQYSRLTNKVDHLGTVILRYAYDAGNRLTNRWSAAKGNTAYAYDSAGNLALINYPTSPDVTLQYDSLNRLTNMVDAAGTTKYTYTTAGRLLTEDGPFADDTVSNTYQNGLRVGLSLQQPSGAWTNGFGHDAAARLTNVTSQAGSFGYTLGGASPASPLIKRILLPNTAYITNAYGPVARLSGTWLKNSSHTVLDAATYGYNTADQRTTYTNALGVYQQYLYDRTGQLTVVDSSDFTEDRGYAYDAAWNLQYRTNNGVIATYTLNSLNEVTGDGAFTYSYDANGNSTVRSSSNTYFVFSYDDENRLTRIEDTLNATFRTDFVYDGLGRMRLRLEYTNDVGTSFPGETLLASWVLATETRYVYDGNRVIQERDGVNTPTVTYTRGTDLSGSLEGAGGIGGLLARSHGYTSGSWSTHNFYHADGNGNITYLVDSFQGLAASYRYEAFGNLISKSGPLADANVYRFSSKELHVNSGLYYYLYRFYDPQLQRWLNLDPLGEPGFESPRRRHTSRLGDGPNLFVFLRNEPLTKVDKDGLICFLRPRRCTPTEVQRCNQICEKDHGPGWSARFCLIAVYQVTYPILPPLIVLEGGVETMICSCWKLN